MPTPDEVTVNKASFAKRWDPNEPVKNFFHQLEDAYLKSIVMNPPFTMEQVIYKAKTTVMQTNLYPTAMLKWNNFLPTNQIWPELWLHFTDAYDLVCTRKEGKQHEPMGNMEPATCLTVMATA